MKTLRLLLIAILMMVVVDAYSQTWYVLKSKDGGTYYTWIAIDTHEGRVLMADVKKNYPKHEISYLKISTVNPLTYTKYYKECECDKEQCVVLFDYLSEKIVIVPLNMLGEHFDFVADQKNFNKRLGR